MSLLKILVSTSAIFGLCAPFSMAQKQPVTTVPAEIIPVNGNPVNVANPTRPVTITKPQVVVPVDNVGVTRPVVQPVKPVIQPPIKPVVQPPVRPVRPVTPQPPEDNDVDNDHTE